MNLESVTTHTGELFVDRTAGDSGSKGAFLRAYDDPRGETRWGFFCANCGAADNAVDTMGRIECNECGNVRKPDGWDDAHE